MTPALKRKMKAALDELDYECAYEDQRMGDSLTFILPGKLGPGIGAKTIETLLSLGLIEAGVNRWHNEPGYRITEAGRSALESGRF